MRTPPENFRKMVRSPSLGRDASSVRKRVSQARMHATKNSLHSSTSARVGPLSAVDSCWHAMHACHHLHWGPWQWACLAWPRGRHECLQQPAEGCGECSAEFAAGRTLMSLCSKRMRSQSLYASPVSCAAARSRWSALFRWE
jgi:hypothetical protein